MTRYSKALWAFASTVVGALIVAVTAIPTHSLRDIGTLGWLTLAATVLATTGGVYGLTNGRPWAPSAPIDPERVGRILARVGWPEPVSDVGDASRRLDAAKLDASAAAARLAEMQTSGTSGTSGTWPPSAGNPPIT